jgi:prepilin-type N-terminal cleavage/methylation domain-containing protein
MRTRGTRAGFTLIEMALSLVLLSVIGGVLFLTTDSTSSAFRTGIAVAELDARALRALERICEDLKTSSSALTTPQSETPFSGHQLDYQRGLGTDAAGSALWGPVEHLELEYEEADDGVDNDSDGLVDECRLVWTENPGLPGERRVVVCSEVSEYLEGETFDGTDENGNGLIDERGFSLDFGENRVNVRLSLEGRDKQGHRLQSTVERTVAFRNEGS